MNEQRSRSPAVVNLLRPGCAVKARIVAAGLSMTDVAQEAGVSRPNLSDHLSGRRGKLETQYDIYLAFCRLTGTDIKALSISEFWGSLYHRRRTL